MKKMKKKGFTLTELIVVLVILAIITAIAVPFFVNYWRRAEFRKNESNAKTIYLAAESKLTYYRSSSQWEAFQKQVKAEGIVDKSSSGNKNANIYAITLDADSYNKETKSSNAVLTLLDDYTYDKEILKGAISLEIDIDSGEVYSAFYATKCKGLNYASDDENGYLTMTKRDYESRRNRLLGYYSAEDMVNTVSLKPTRLRITTISLQNSEKLSLNWSTNAGEALDVSYEISFYKDGDKSKLFTMTVSPYDMRAGGWANAENDSESLAMIALKDSSGVEQGNWAFPISYSDNRYSLVLDAMMSAKVQAVLDAQSDMEKTELEKTSSVSICRLGAVAADLKEEQNIYATVKATSYAGTSKLSSTTEYRDSEPVSSNTANTMYADATSGSNVKLSTFRHLSNIRYYTKKQETTFTLTGKNMDWSAVRTGLYDLSLSKSRSVETLSWVENDKDSITDFPTIAELSSNYTLKGNGQKTLISNLHLGKGSAINDETAEQLKSSKTELIGLFGKVSGNIQNVTLQNPVLYLVNGENGSFYQLLKGVGILAGQNAGSLNGVTIKVTKAQNGNTVQVSMENSTNSSIGIGGLVGIIEADSRSGSYAGQIEASDMEGKIEAKLPTANTNDAEEVSYGIGGIVGYASLKNTTGSAKISNCENHAEITGNMFTGGIAGKLEGTFERISSEQASALANIRECSSDGLILCSDIAQDGSLKGMYFGGIAGYTNRGLIYASGSASGRSQSFSFDSNKKKLLLGKYVGGIVGYGNASLLNNCSTEKGGYILGSDYVGGIAGEMKGGSNAIQADNGVAVTTNRSYVIGNNYVGGIVGQNENNVTIENCVNNGVAAGYGNYVGGIVGYNAEDAKLADCASYLSDYDNSVFNMIVNEWEAKADYVGGLAGYNDGSITFTNASQAVTVKSVSSIVVGNNYVGGLAGFNDVDGTLDVSYELIGGRVYAYGDCAGGGFGLNASTKILDKELVIKPRSIQGRYCVGGCIGANIVALEKDTTIANFRTNNSLGVITGEAFCGGLIGYQRTYAALSGKLLVSAESLLPSLSTGNLPVVSETTTNAYTLTITTAGNSAESLSVETNNAPIRADIYAGGILGYCEKNSKLVIQNCKNEGNISQNSGEKEVNLGVYIKSTEVGQQSLPTEAKNVNMHLVGGIIGVNLQNHVIEHCTNTGSLSGYSGTGGIVGLNAGLIVNCRLDEHFGNAALSYLGGIAGVNVGVNGESETEHIYDSRNYTAGTIQNCSTKQGKTITGRNTVGGIVGWNLQGGTLVSDSSYANVVAFGNYIGGLAGKNSGTVQVSNDSEKSVRTITGTSGEGIGGIVGINEKDGIIQIKGNSGQEVVAVGNGVSVTGALKVGGIVGINQGILGTDQMTGAQENPWLVCSAQLVRASRGTVGGIVGETTGDIGYAINRSTNVTAYAGAAGGIAAVSGAESTVKNCKGYGNVSSSDGYAAGIVSVNAGRIQDCVVGEENQKLTIYSLGEEESGTVCAVNNGIIDDSKPVGTQVVLEGNASTFGGVTGRNNKTVQNIDLTVMPKINSAAGKLTVGGIAGQNAGIIGQEKETSADIQVSVDFENFDNYKYLGGVAGQNERGATVQNSTYTGTIAEKTGMAGNCYGGITGENSGTLNTCAINKIRMEIRGVYTATSTSTTVQKESSSSHAGGIAGKNEETGKIINCTLTDNKDSVLKAQYGMLGGIAGFNKGTIQMSGSNLTSRIVTVEKNANAEQALQQMSTQAKDAGLTADSTYLSWNGSANAQVENVTYNGSSKKTSDDRLQMHMVENGNLGGISAYNATSGEIKDCVSGNWFLVNKSNAIGVGTGGIIGMNESEKDMSRLVNGAFVGRQISNADTNRFAGGIIGNQNNTTSSDWTITDCINYGTVYCYNTHYSGGIMGQWTGSGGTIQNCVNYGTLQTTYGTDWVGASGGIVAQLYHAYENQEYNIISSGNYGSIYTKQGQKWDNMCGANDSAGILGNITTYRANNTEQAQNFTVQILDCFNAPGVKIYSGSMASGIFGFLSCDNPNKNYSTAVKELINSTAKVTLRIERCRNFAEELKGYNYYAGIFGDRYGTAAWEKYTIVKDCYSVRGIRGGKTTDTYYPIYSKGNGQGTSVNMLPENRIHNYYIEGMENWGYTNVRIGEGLDSLGRGSGSAQNGNYENGLNAQNQSADVIRDKGKYTMNVFFMYDLTAGKYFVANINARTTAGMTRVDGQNQYIDSDGYIKKADGTKTGEVLYYVDEKAYDNTRLYEYALKDASNPLFVNARTSWKRLEGIVENEAGREQILKPANAEATIADGKITMNIVPDVLHRNLTDTTEKCDPFAYEIKISDGINNVIHKIYTENGSFDIPSGLDKISSIQVRAISMYEDVEPSDWLTVDTRNINKVLPDPDIRVELVVDKDGNSDTRGHAYRYRLANLDEYNATDVNGNPLYPDWQVKINIQRVGNITLDAQNPEEIMRVRDENNLTYQMVAQASLKDSTSSLAEASKEISVPVSLPYYRPPITLKTWDPMLTTNISISGDTLDDLSVKVELDSGSKTMNTPPIYRAELIGTWNGESDVVFAKEDILTVSAGKATATFTNLPEYLGEAKNLKVRIWYASSGLGPVYTYYDVDASDLTNANVKELVSVDENGQETWQYKHSTVLENIFLGGEYYFKNYIYHTNELWSWLDAPEFDAVGTTLEPEIGKNGELYYQFQWDTNLSTTGNPSYKVSLVGIDEDSNGKDREVTIDIGDAYKGGRTLRVDGTDWDYKEVKLKVTRIGDASQKKIGLSSTGTYKTKQRLEKPSQPVVVNVDENELNYQITWSAISSEDGCAGYQIYVQPYEDGKLGQAEAIGSIVTPDKQRDGIYEESVNLEAYAGKRVLVYLIAKAEKNGEYLDSTEGVTYELQIPKRLAKPTVSWSENWTYNRTNPVEAEKFQSGGLRVSLVADKESIPPGGSAYLLKAYVYNSEEEANKATDTNAGNYIEAYPKGDTPVQMSVKNSQEYYHDMENLSITYAGKWIVFYARISSGGGNVSSEWTRMESAVRLPYVKLDAPEVTSDTKNYDLTVKVTDTPEVPGEEKTWKASHTVLNWESVDGVTLYRMNLDGSITDGSSQDSTKKLNAQIRVSEQADKTVKVEKYVQRQDEQTKEWKWVWEQIDENEVDYPIGTPETAKTHTFNLDNYSVQIDSGYGSYTGARMYYNLELQAQLEVVLQEDGGFAYTLKLPDVTEMYAHDGSTVKHTNFAITTNAKFIADVIDNLTGVSTAYVPSEETEIKWN